MLVTIGAVSFLFGLTIFLHTTFLGNEWDRMGKIYQRNLTAIMLITLGIVIPDLLKDFIQSAVNGVFSGWKPALLVIISALFIIYLLTLFEFHVRDGPPLINP